LSSCDSPRAGVRGAGRARSVRADARARLHRHAIDAEHCPARRFAPVGGPPACAPSDERRLAALASVLRERRHDLLLESRTPLGADARKRAREGVRRVRRLATAAAMALRARVYIPLVSPAGRCGCGASLWYIGAARIGAAGHFRCGRCNCMYRERAPWFPGSLDTSSLDCSSLDENERTAPARPGLHVRGTGYSGRP